MTFNGEGGQAREHRDNSDMAWAAMWRPGSAAITSLGLPSTHAVRSRSDAFQQFCKPRLLTKRIEQPLILGQEWVVQEIIVDPVSAEVCAVATRACASSVAVAKRSTGCVAKARRTASSTALDPEARWGGDSANRRAIIA